MTIAPLFRNREDAGERLAEKLQQESTIDARPLVLALPRGGVPIGFKVAQALHAELDVFLVRKLGVPGHEELAMGAIASGGMRMLNDALIAELGISAEAVAAVTAHEEQEIERQERVFRENQPAIPVTRRSVILVDDGSATGASMRVAAHAVREQEPRRITVAVPVASRQACYEFWRYVDDVVCVGTPEPFYAVGAWYTDFVQVTDAEVQRLLQQAAHVRVA
jgi:putative phosphoribosyl transferase